MSTDEPMNDLLSELATTDAPSPDPAFVEHLDARLRVAHAERTTVSSPRARWVPALAVAAVLVVGLAGAIVIDDRVTLVVGGTDQQPTDPDRSATGGQDDDERADPRPTISVRATGSGSTGGGTASEPDRPAESSPSTTIASDGPTTAPSTDVDTGSTTVAPEPTRPPPTRPSSTTTSPVRPTTATTTVPTDLITLTVTEVDGDRLRLDWVIGRDLAPMGWRIRAQRGDRATTLLVIRGGDARSATLERAQTVGRSLWVEAVDRSGHTLAASDPITIR